MFRKLIYASILLLMGFAPGCGEEDGAAQGPTTPAELNRAVLSQLATNVISTTYAKFSQHAEALVEACTAWAGSQSDTDLESARAAWREAMAVWQQAEVFQVGPAGDADDVLGGAGIRDAVYSWPLSNTCRIDQETVEGAYSDHEAFASEAINVQGLDAIEYLLFVPTTANSCRPNSALNTSGSWDVLGEAEVTQNRADYAVAVASLVAGHAKTLVAEWTPGTGSAIVAFANAGDDTSVYPTAHHAMNSVSDALFYLDTETKDMKLGVPAGISDGCAEDACPEESEHVYADFSIQAIKNNILGFQLVFTGDSDGQSGPGLDELLNAAGAEALATELHDAIDGALAAADAVENSLQEAVVTTPELISDLYAACQAITTPLKTDMMTVLDFEVPTSAEGDND